MDADQLRRAFTGYFVEREHTLVPSAGLIPHHPRAPLFTNAGMNQFIPYFLGEEAPPYRRATSIQKCVRINGKHDDIEQIGRTTRHGTFFEMLGNWSFGDYFKEGAIDMAWDLVTRVLGLDGERIWASVYQDDDEAVEIWRHTVGLPVDRIVRLGADDNFWEMGDAGPCGPDSELHFDRGPEYGAEGGPGRGGEERYVEFWNLVFMQSERMPDGSLEPLPAKNVDTGAGLERMLTLLQDVPAVWETDAIRPIIAAAERLTGHRYGADPEVDVALRIMADHTRSMTFLIGDGVFPGNEDRGYVLRRLIRRTVRQAFTLGMEKPVTPDLVASCVEVMGVVYPDVVRQRDSIIEVAEREEGRFRATLRSGLAMLEAELATGRGRVSGEVAFRLHDTHGFPVELTREVAAERGVEVDMAGFEAEMAAQRDRARKAGKEGLGATAADDRYRELLDEHGPTVFLGYDGCVGTGRVLAVIPRDGHLEGRDEPEASPTGYIGGRDEPEGSPTGYVEVFLDRTPFYAEGGGQVGDTGRLQTPTGVVEVEDTTYALPGLIRHVGRVVEGELAVGQEAEARVDSERRDSIRRNHTATHLLHWALREVLGDHVKQQGSEVGPDRLRFDFSHFGAPTAEEMARVQRLVNEVVITDAPVRTTERSMDEARALGAIAFFGDRYGERVRVVEAGDASMELCGGTHVGAVGMIGPVRIVSEGSIGASTRRLEALTGAAALERIDHDEALLEEAAALLKSPPEEIASAVARLMERQKASEDALRQARRRGLSEQAVELAAAAADGVVVSRVDGLASDQLRDLAVAVRQRDGVRVVVLGGSPDGERVALVAAVAKGGSELVASDLLAPAAKLVGGGGGRNAELATAGGRDAGRLDEALDGVRRMLGA